MVPSKGLALAPIQFQAEVLAFSGRELAPWNNCSTLRTFLGQNHLSDGNIQEAPGVRASESTRLVERTMGIESTSEVWESTNPFVGRSAAFMRPRRRRRSSEKARSRWQFRCIAAPRNHFVIRRPESRIPAFFVQPLAGEPFRRTPSPGNPSPLI